MAWLRVVGLLALLPACSDYNLERVPDPCNGRDDDGDGVVNPGFPDSDGDGIADCVDEVCELHPVPDTAIAIEPACRAGTVDPVDDPWDVVVEWEWIDDRGLGSWSKPAVARLHDDNGDGVIDEADMPDIVFTQIEADRLVVLRGDGSGPRFELDGISGYKGVAVADADGDGRADIVALTPDRRVALISGEGERLWTSEPVGLTSFTQPTVADLDGDGHPEVVADSAVLDGATGARLATLDIDVGYVVPAVGDLDLDGVQEVVVGQSVFEPDGTERWRMGLTRFDADAVFPAIANVDADPEGELVVVYGFPASTLAVFDTDGTRLLELPIGFRGGAPAVADFDGDGVVEIVVPTNSAVELFELDGTRRWSVPAHDESGVSTCSAADLDGDGVHEVVYADETAMWILDGATGEVRFQGPHASTTGFEYPVVADVDNDGAAEIVVVSGTPYPVDGVGVRVLGHRTDGWVAASTTWGLYDDAVTNQNPDGSVPSGGDPPWLGDNMVRVRPTGGAIAQPARADLAFVLADVCVASCELGRDGRFQQMTTISWASPRGGGRGSRRPHRDVEGLFEFRSSTLRSTRLVRHHHRDRGPLLAAGEAVDHDQCWVA